MIHLWRPTAVHIMIRWLWSLGVLVWSGVSLSPSGAEWRSASPLFLAELLLGGLPGLCASTSLTCQVAVAHLTFRLCFPSDNCCLMAASKLQWVFGCHLHIFFFPSLQIDWLGHCTATPPQTRQPHDINHILTFIWLILYFRIPVTSVRPPKAMSVASVFQITNCAAVQRFDQPAGSTSSNIVAIISNVL